MKKKNKEIEIDKQNELKAVKSIHEIELKQIDTKITDLKNEIQIYNSGNESSGEKGLLQINKDIELNKKERDSIENSFILKRFWKIGIIIKIIILIIFFFYLSIFFSSAMYKVFFEGNIIRTSLEAGINPGLPQIVDANAILKIFNSQGALFGMMALFFFLIPVLLSNLKLIGSEKKWVNNLFFWVGILVFDIVVAIMVAMNADEIKSLLIGQQSQLKIWEVPQQGEFWLIFVFGMLPLIITHFLIKTIVDAYENSQLENVDAAKNKQIQKLDKQLIELNLNKEIISKKLKDTEDILDQRKSEIENLEKEMNNQQNQIEKSYSESLKKIQTIFDDFYTRIKSGKIFTNEILNSVSIAYKSGFIDYLPKLYAEKEVANRVREIEQVINKHS